MFVLLKQEEDLQAHIRNSSPCFDMWSTGTGAWTEMIAILDKLYQAGYDLMKDVDLQHVFGYVNCDGKISSYVSEIYDTIKQK